MSCSLQDLSSPKSTGLRFRRLIQIVALLLLERASYSATLNFSFFIYKIKQLLQRALWSTPKLY